jgi:hypothetical protein
MSRTGESNLPVFCEEYDQSKSLVPLSFAAQSDLIARLESFENQGFSSSDRRSMFQAIPTDVAHGKNFSPSLSRAQLFPEGIYR